MAVVAETSAGQGCEYSPVLEPDGTLDSVGEVDAVGLALDGNARHIFVKVFAQLDIAGGSAVVGTCIEDRHG